MLLPSVQSLPLTPPSVLSCVLLVLHPPCQDEDSDPQEEPDHSQAQQQGVDHEACDAEYREEAFLSLG